MSITGIAVALALAAATPAQAQVPKCFSIEAYKTQFGETVFSTMRSRRTGGIYVFLVNPATGTWTVGVLVKVGTVCVVDFGTDWTEPPRGDPA